MFLVARPYVDLVNFWSADRNASNSLEELYNMLQDTLVDFQPLITNWTEGYENDLGYNRSVSYHLLVKSKFQSAQKAILLLCIHIDQVSTQIFYRTYQLFLSCAVK